MAVPSLHITTSESESLVKSLHYFDDLITQMRRFIGVEEAELADCAGATRVLEIAVADCVRADARLGTAEAALEAAQFETLRLRNELRILLWRGKDRAYGYLSLIEANPAVRDEYKAILRFSLGDSDAQSSPVPMTWASATDAPLHPPTGVRILPEAGSTNRVTWEYPEAADTFFEIEAAVGSIRDWRGAHTAYDGNAFEFRTVTGLGARSFVHNVIGSNNAPARPGVPVKYRLRAVRGERRGEWTENIPVAYVGGKTLDAIKASEPPKESFLNRLFTLAKKEG